MNTGTTGTLDRAFARGSDAFFEGLQRLRLAARPFRENHQNLAAV